MSGWIKKSLRGRWRQLGFGAVALVLIGLVVGYHVIITKVRSELSALVRNNLNGELRSASISYRPPYGIIVRNALIVCPDGQGGKFEFLRFNQLNLKLAGLPHAGKPVIITSLRVDGPTVKWVSGSPISHPDNARSRPSSSSISDELQIHSLLIENGSFHFSKAGSGTDPALSAQNIRLAVGGPPGILGAQPFTLTARSDQTTIRTNGSFNPGNTLLKLDDLALDIRLSPAAREFPLPPHVSDWISRYGRGGSLSIRGEGQIPFKTPQQSTFNGTIDANDISAAWPDSKSAPSKANLKVVFDSGLAPGQTSGKAPQGIHARLLLCDVYCQGINLKVDGAEFWTNITDGTWKLARLEGHAAGVVPGGQEPAPAVLRGRVDFTATAGGPLKLPPGAPAAKAIQYEVLALPRDLAFQPKVFPLPIDHIDGTLRAQGGVITMTDMSGNYGGDKLIIDSARVPLSDDVSRLWTLETRIEEVSGSLICFQPGPIYPRAIQETFAALHPQGKFDIGSARLTLNHRSREPGKPTPKDDFALDISSDGSAAFSLTDKQIPVTRVHGKATIDNLAIVIGTDGVHDSVVEGRCLNGTASVHMRVTPGVDRNPARFKGEAWARDVNMTLLLDSLKMPDGRVAKAGGTGFMHGTFLVMGAGGPKDPMSSLQADAEAEVIGADFWEDPVVGVIARYVTGTSKGPRGSSGGSASQPGVGDAAAVVHVADRNITLKSAAASSPSVGLEGSGTISFDGDLNLDVVATPIGDLRSMVKQVSPPGAGNVAADLAGGIQVAVQKATSLLLYHYRVTGPAAHPHHVLVPSPVISEGGAILFGRMLQPDHQRLLDSVRLGMKSSGNPSTRPATGGPAK